MLMRLWHFIFTAPICLRLLSSSHFQFQSLSCSLSGLCFYAGNLCSHGSYFDFVLSFLQLRILDWVAVYSFFCLFLGLFDHSLALDIPINQDTSRRRVKLAEGLRELSKKVAAVREFVQAAFDGLARKLENLPVATQADEVTCVTPIFPVPLQGPSFFILSSGSGKSTLMRRSSTASDSRGILVEIDSGLPPLGIPGVWAFYKHLDLIWLPVLIMLYFS